MKTEFIGIRIERDIKERLLKIAASKDKTLSRLIQRIVREYLKGENYGNES